VSARESGSISHAIGGGGGGGSLLAKRLGPPCLPVLMLSQEAPFAVPRLEEPAA